MKKPKEETPPANLIRFAPGLEAAFQTRHYANVRHTLRLASLLLAALALLYAGRDLLDTSSLAFALRSGGAAVAYYLAVFALTFAPGFGRVWQPTIVLGGWLATLATLNTMMTFLHVAPPGARPVPPVPRSIADSMYFNVFFTLQTCVLMVSVATFRLNFLWALPLQLGIVAIGVGEIATREGGDAAHHVARFSQATLLVLFAVLLAAYVQESLARRAFLANHLLDRARGDEQGRRERSEATLRSLGQAIGGIVHDLGNPLTTVQLGASTLRDLAGQGRVEPRHVETFARHIEDGAQMLSFLRLSLIEQTRVLEGRPTPVERTTVPLRRIVEAGVRYQRPADAFRRSVTVEGDDIDVFADEMKLVTVVMNLVGNALKYSDGAVRVVWTTAESTVAVAVLDQGRDGRGLTRVQAESLFLPFGRLDAHREIEGTGLGLLSVRNIAEAHGGEVYIEGYTDGAEDSPAFRLAHRPAAVPPLLADGFRTAFVFLCPRPDPDTLRESE